MVSTFLTALALLCWPNTRARSRLNVIVGHRSRKRLRLTRPTAFTTTLAAVAAGWLIAGPGGAAAASLLTTTARRQRRIRAKNHESLTAIDGMAEALHSLVAGLRAGAHPARAAELAALDAHPDTAAAMRAVASAARLDGDLTSVPDATRPPALAAALSRLTTAWRLAHRHGLPLAEVLDAARHDLEQRARFTRQVLARMTGPRSSALALSVLPLLGIALGEAMGAHPLRLLTGTGLGQALLITGTALLCAGITWSARITGRVIHP